MSGRYFTSDAAFTLPDGLTDRTVNILEWTVERTSDRLTLLLQREKVTPAVSLEDFVSKHTRSYAGEFEAYHLEQQVARESDLAEAVHLTFRFKKQHMVLYTHQAFVHVGPLILVFTASAKATHRDRVDELVDAVMRTLEIREPA
jgi:hypothetical protein